MGILFLDNYIECIRSSHDVLWYVSKNDNRRVNCNFWELVRLGLCLDNDILESVESGNLGSDELLLGPRTMIPTSGNDQKNFSTGIMLP